MLCRPGSEAGSYVLIAVLTVVLVNAPAPFAAQDSPHRVETEFKDNYAAWKNLLESPGVRWRSEARVYASEPFLRMVELGPPVTPYAIEAMREDSGPASFRLKSVLYLVTANGLPMIGRMSNQERSQAWIDWWDAGQKGTDALFARAYEAHEINGIAALGWGAMPRIVEKLKEGDEDLMKAVRQIALVEVRLKRIPSEAVEDSESWIAWWEKNKGDWAIPFPDLQKEKDKEADGESAPEQE